MTDMSKDTSKPQGKALPAGLAEALGAYGIWGFLPLYFKMMANVAPWEVVGQRVVWSVGLVLIMLAFRKRLGELARVLTTPRLFGPLFASSVLIATNWLVYVWAVYNGHVLAASLGYFLNPLLNILLGSVVLKEKLRPLQWASAGLAAIGVAILAFGALDTLWISLTLAGTFGIYGLIRKMVDTGPLVGLAAETIIMMPVAVAFLLWWGSVPGRAAFGAGNITTDMLLIGCGAVTAVPLLLFASAARKLPYSTLGLIQYVAPTIVFLIGIFVFKEPLLMSQLICFLFIWAGIAVYIWDGMRARKAIARQEPAAINTVTPEL